MSNKVKKYQLWVHYTTQNAEEPRSSDEYSLVYSTDDNLNELFVCKVEAERNGNITQVTRIVTLEVDVL